MRVDLSTKKDRLVGHDTGHACDAYVMPHQSVIDGRPRPACCVLIVSAIAIYSVQVR